MAPFKVGDSCEVKRPGGPRYAGAVARVCPGKKTVDDPEYYEVDVREEWGKDDKGLEGWQPVANRQRVEYDAEYVKKPEGKSVAGFTK